MAKYKYLLSSYKTGDRNRQAGAAEVSEQWWVGDGGVGCPVAAKKKS